MISRTTIRRLTITLLVSLAIVFAGAASAASAPTTSQSNSQVAMTSLTAAAQQPASALTSGCPSVISVVCGAGKSVVGTAKSVASVGTAGVSCVKNPAKCAGQAVSATGVDKVADVAKAASDPLGTVGGVVAKAAADLWSNIMLAIWHAGMYLLRIVLEFAEAFLVPDLSPNGPGRDVYPVMMGLGATLATTLIIYQIGVAMFKRDGKSLGKVAVGTAQYLLVCAVFLVYCGAMMKAVGELNRWLMGKLLGSTTWPGWDPMGGLSTQTVTDAVVATILGILGFFLIFAAIGHLLVYLARGASLAVLVATAPISAAGLMSDVGDTWFWKAARWFHAAAFTPPLMVIILGIGGKMAEGVAAHMADDTAAAVGTALIAVTLICISVVSPMALFKLLAFVDPGSPSGASFRQGLAIQGGAAALFSGGGNNSTKASESDENGQSSGEKDASGSTGSRLGGASGALGALGKAYGAGLGMLSKAGSNASALVTDQTNQAGVGTHTYGPDFSTISQHAAAGGPLRNAQTAVDEQNGSDSGSGANGGAASAAAEVPPVA